ncbi:hypothetical protein IE53DRAFT_207116 [Violaceomyces palustris]|uniref:Uncharacterized protein n=1 Tax=Violaceomyces palustris TaxID=1673888 RepID=A0ACD0NQV9_9BASI|nr:hypothetical protein IE53DRAFT_207116 [Violaceomyces palustris]
MDRRSWSSSSSSLKPSSSARQPPPSCSSSSSSSRPTNSQRLPGATSSLRVQLSPSELARQTSTQSYKDQTDPGRTSTFLQRPRQLPSPSSQGSSPSTVSLTLPPKSDAQLITASLLNNLSHQKLVLHHQEKLIVTPRNSLEFFKRSLGLFNLSTYLEVVEERRLSLLCPYPTCGNPPPKPRGGTHRISLGSRKVTRNRGLGFGEDGDEHGGASHERMWFCSSECWRRSEWVCRYVLRESVMVGRAESASASTAAEEAEQDEKGQNWEEIELLEDLNGDAEVEERLIRQGDSRGEDVVKIENEAKGGGGGGRGKVDKGEKKVEEEQDVRSLLDSLVIVERGKSKEDDLRDGASKTGVLDTALERQVSNSASKGKVVSWEVDLPDHLLKPSQGANKEEDRKMTGTRNSNENPIQPERASGREASSNSDGRDDGDDDDEDEDHDADLFLGLNQSVAVLGGFGRSGKHGLQMKNLANQIIKTSNTRAFGSNSVVPFADAEDLGRMGRESQGMGEGREDEERGEEQEEGEASEVDEEEERLRRETIKMMEEAIKIRNAQRELGLLP